MTRHSPGDPLVSIVLPVRDGAVTLDAALESLRAQTFGGFEVLVVDDGSSDESPRIARAWERRDGRFRLVRLGSGGERRAAAVNAASPRVGPGPCSMRNREPRAAAAPGGDVAKGTEPESRHTMGGTAAVSRHGPGGTEPEGRHSPSGIVAALQRGLAESRGRYVARMDADDVSHPERLAAQIDVLERAPELAGCGTGVRHVPASAVTAHAAEYAAWLNAMTDWRTVAANIFVECPLAHPTFMFRRRVLSDIGGYRDRGWPEDYDLLLRLWRRGHRFVAVPRVLLDWGDDPGRLSRNHPAYSLAAFRACRVHHLRRSLLAGREGVVVWGAGPTGKRLAVEFQRQGVRVAGFVEVDPRKIGQVIHGAPVRGAGGRGEFGAVLHVGAVARAAGREAVRAAAMEAGLEEGADFVSMA